MMSRQPHIFYRTLLISIFLACIRISSFGQQPGSTERKVQNPIGIAEEEARSLRKVLPSNVSVTEQKGPQREGSDLSLKADRSEGQGDVLIYIGSVEAHYENLTIFADRLTANFATGDVVAEGDVFFEQEGQSLVGDRIELNLKTKRGFIYAASGFTDRTPDGSRVIIDAERVDRTGEDTYRLEHARITSCQERVPKWSFTSKRARIKLDDKATVYNALLRVKNVPVFYLPYATVPITKRDRASGLLLPTSGSSSIKGRTFHAAYFQTLGQSADVLFRGDVYTKRGFGAGFDFRARPDENSRIAVGSFMVFDRLLGPKNDENGNPLPDQGGSSFYVDAVQYFKNGFVAVADVNITSNFDFRQVFAENIQQAVSPEERSLVYVNRNWKSFSFNGLFGERSAFIANTTVKTRTLPSLELSQRSTRISEAFPVYVSFDGALEGVRRTESTGFTNDFSFKTPSIVQRLDFGPRITIPLRSFYGWAVTPSLGVRSTFYSDSLDPAKREVTGQNLWRNYAEFVADIRPPALAKIFRHGDGTPSFKHIIEPYATYRRIVGIDEFDRTLRIDERDVIAETNEFEYGLTNRFFVRRPGPDGQTMQAHEILEFTVAQKYFFDPTFGDALTEGVRNQFFPINTLSGFSFGGTRRTVSPLNLKARYRPTQALFADVRMNYDTKYHQLRDLIFGGGITRGIFSLSQSWYYTRRIAIDEFRNDPSSLPGNQLDVSGFAGNPSRGPYAGFTVIYDLRDKTSDGLDRGRRLINLTSTAGWAWDCCSVQVQNLTFKVGVRNENRIVFAFTLKGLGTFGTENIGQRRHY
jgi:LPS-assembly protein